MKSTEGSLYLIIFKQHVLHCQYLSWADACWENVGIVYSTRAFMKQYIDSIADVNMAPSGHIQVWRRSVLLCPVTIVYMTSICAK